MSELRVDNIVSEDGSAAPIYSKGMTIGAGQTLTCAGDFSVGGNVTFDSGATVTGVVTFSSADLQSNLSVSSLNSSGIVTASSFSGDGSNLTGIDATQIQTGNTSVQTVDTGSDGHVKVTTEGTERLRVDSSGRTIVGGGITSRSIGGSNSAIQIETNDSSGRLSVVQNRNDAGGCPFITLGKSRGTTYGSSSALQDDDTIGTIAFAGADGTDIETIAAQIRVEVDNTPGSNDIPGRMIFDTTADGDASPSEAMRITSLNSPQNASLDHAIWMSSGNAPDIDETGWKLYVRGSTRFYNPYDYTPSASRKGQYEFYSNSGGNTNNSDAWNDQKSSVYITGWLESGNPGESASVLLLNGRWGGATNPGMLIKGYNYTANFVFEVNRNGDVKNQNNSYSALSDEKLKQDIVDADSQWEDIKNLRVRKFKLKSDIYEEQEMGAEPAVLKLGLIAQEAELVCPGLVNTPPGYDIPEQEKYKSIKYSILYMKAVKALQEAQERIETLESTVSDLTSRITALEGG